MDEVAPAGVFEMIERFEILSRRMRAVRAKLLTRANDGGLWAAHGARSFSAWMATRLGSDRREVNKTVREASALEEHLPKMSAAVASGEIDWGHAAAVVRYGIGSDTQREALADPRVGEEFLVEKAKEFPVIDYRQIARVWAERADPEAGDARWQDHVEQEYLVLSKTMDGYHLQGWLSEVNGKTVADAINAAIGIPPEGDKRSVQERNAQGLTDIAHTILSTGTLLPDAAVRPHLSVTVEYATFQNLLTNRNNATNAGNAAGAGTTGAGYGQTNANTGAHGNVNGVNGVAAADTDASGLDGGQSVADLRREPTLSNGVVLTPAQLEFLSCDSEVTRIIFGPKSEILDVGRAKRTVTSQLRKAVLARDRGCQFPGCGAAPYTLEIHHIQHWANGGVTSAGNSITLCRFHHQHVHQREITITPSQHTGRWQFHDPDGQLLNTRDPLSRLTTENTETQEHRPVDMESGEAEAPKSEPRESEPAEPGPHEPEPPESEPPE